MDLPKIPYGRQHINDDDIQSVIKVLKSEHLTQGPEIGALEKAFSEYVGSKYAIAVSNGTAALHLSVLALGLKSGEKVITTPISFVATTNCVKFCGGDIVFSDIDSKTYLLDINKVRKILIDDVKKEIKGIIPVNFAGRVVDMEAFKKLANEFGCWILEDSCHSPGGYFLDSQSKKQLSGNGKFADASIFSFHPVKHIAAGEGGMITTDNEKLYKKILNLRTHGIEQDPSKLIYDNSLWYYEMQELGFNYRLSDIHASLARSQLKRAKVGLDKRKEIATKYYEYFKGKSYIKGQSTLIEGHAYHLYVIEVEERKELHSYLRKLNIWCQIHYIPIHLMPFYRDLCNEEGNFPSAENYYKSCISLPIFPTLKTEEQDFVIKSINNFFLHNVIVSPAR
jgi:UDP-4-amino-4,6-dideoxy-N-acetyl-beta-L-altrosamine transaminase